ncbi:hypothetical protein M2432_005212 [Mycobacterium sp. OTB74]|nr:hypothetical protein [Mycobacterium sp. OTB74]
MNSLMVLSPGQCARNIQHAAAQRQETERLQLRATAAAYVAQLDKALNVSCCRFCGERITADTTRCPACDSYLPVNTALHERHAGPIRYSGHVGTILRVR